MTNLEGIEKMPSCQLPNYLGTNAQGWAVAFRKICPNGGLIDEGVLIGWFANAIEQGREAGLRQEQKEHPQGRDGAEA